MNPRVHELLAMLEAGPLSARELAARLEVSQPTVSRLVFEAGDRVLHLGQGRSKRYALPRVLPGLGYRFPLYRVDKLGVIQDFGVLEAYQSGYQVVLVAGNSLQFDDLPWFLQDMRLQGFLGRLAVRYLQDHAVAGVEIGGRLNEWSSDQVLAFLLRRQIDGVGDLLVGGWTRDIFQPLRWKSAIGVISDRGSRYPLLSQQALDGTEDMLSSAAGEQPKFMTHRPEDDWPCIVKFSPLLDTAAGQRWADLLYCEYLALTVLHEHGVAATTPSVYHIDNRVYFEVPRFDREGLLGRYGVASLEAVNGEFSGGPYADGWSGAGAALARKKIITKADAERMARLEAFGRCIANTDMHFGNLAFFRSPTLELSLAPIYDMLPMYYAPVNGEVVSREVPALRLPAALAKHADWARSAASEFWRRVTQDERISQEFRGIAQQHLQLLS